MCKDGLIYYCWHVMDQGLQISWFKLLPPGLKTLQCEVTVKMGYPARKKLSCRIFGDFLFLVRLKTS